MLSSRPRGCSPSNACVVSGAASSKPVAAMRRRRLPGGRRSCRVRRLRATLMEFIDTSHRRMPATACQSGPHPAGCEPTTRRAALVTWDQTIGGVSCGFRDRPWSMVSSRLSFGAVSRPPNRASTICNGSREAEHDCAQVRSRWLPQSAQGTSVIVASVWTLSSSITTTLCAAALRLTDAMATARMKQAMARSSGVIGLRLTRKRPVASATDRLSHTSSSAIRPDRQRDMQPRGLPACWRSWR